MTRKKPYNDGCAAAHAMDLIGERWALPIVRELIPGPARFSDLKAALPGISTNILTARLADLEETGIVERRRLEPPAAARVYALTPWGADLEPLICALGRWAARSPTRVPGKPMSAASFMLSLRTMFAADRARGLTADLDLVLNGRPLRARVARGRFTIGPGRAPEPGAVIAGSPDQLAAVVYGRQPLAEAERGGLSVTGDRDLAARFLDLFPLPPGAC